MPSSTNILLFQRIVPHYRVPLFGKLNEELGIVVCHSKAKKGASLSEQLTLKYPNEILPRVYFGKSPTNSWQRAVPVLRKYKPGIVITEFSLSYMTFWWLLFLRVFFKYKLIVWTHGVKSKEMLRPFKSWQSKIQLWVYSKADSVILYSKKRKDLLAQRMKNPLKLFVANNTLDTDELNRVYDDLKANGKETIQKEIGFSHKYNLVFMGRLLPDKRLDILLRAFGDLEKDFDVGLHIIGSGPKEDYVTLFAKNHETIFYHGAIHKLKQSSKYLFAADLMVMPGYVGLSVVHAMAMGCPVLTCLQGINGPYHSPEVEYIENKVNGIFCNYSVEGVNNAVSELLANPGLLSALSINARKTIKEIATMDLFVSGFEQAVNYLNA